MSQNAVREASAQYFVKPESGVEPLVTEHLDLWTSAIVSKNTTGRGSNKKVELYGIKKLRELILDLAVRGKLVPQAPNDEPASELLNRIAENRSELSKAKKNIKGTRTDIGVEVTPFELPGGWSWVRLSALGTVSSSSRVHKKDWESKGVPFYRAREIVKLSHYGSVDNELFITEELYEQLCERGMAPVKNDIMITGVGTIGVPYVVLEKDRFYFKDASVLIFQNHFELYPWYLNIFMRSPFWAASIHEGSMGTTVHTFTISRAKEVLVSLPPLNEQYRIVAKVDELMALCDQLENQTEQNLDAHATLADTLLDALTRAQSAQELAENWQRLEQNWDILFPTSIAGERAIDKLKQTILQLAVMGKLVPQDPNDEPASELLKRIAAEKEQLIKAKKMKKQKPLLLIADEEKPFDLPEGWEWCRFDSLTSLVTSGSRGWKSYYSSSGSVFIRSQDIKKDRLEFDDRAFVELPDSTEGVRTKVENGDLLMTITGANVAKVARIEDAPSKSYVSQHVGLIRLVDTAVGDYLHKWLTAEHGGRRLLLESSYGAKPGLNLLNIRELLIPVAPIQEQKRIVAKVDKLMTLCDQLKQRLLTAQKTKRNFTDAVVATSLEHAG
jgi:type I restriction enzyme S subunit